MRYPSGSSLHASVQPEFEVVTPDSELSVRQFDTPWRTSLSAPVVESGARYAEFGANVVNGEEVKLSSHSGVVSKRRADSVVRAMGMGVSS
jgi:hypothetical protein